MKTFQASALFAGLALALPQGTVQVSPKPFMKPFGETVYGDDRSVFFRVCGDPMHGGNNKINKEYCAGTKIYCFWKKYQMFDEAYDSPLDCLRARGIDPDSLATQGIDRHFWNIDARLEGFGHLENADALYTRSTLIKKMQENILSPELGDRGPENDRIKAALSDKEAVKDPNQEIEQAKQKFQQAYKSEFAKEISDAIDNAKLEMERGWSEFKTVQLAQVNAPGEVSTLLKKANDLYTRSKLIERLYSYNFLSDIQSISSAARQNLDLAMQLAQTLPNAQEVSGAIDRARAAVNQAWQGYNGEKLRGANRWILDHEERW